MNFYRTFKNLTLAALTMTVMAACEGDVFNIDADPFKGKTYINMTNSPISSYLESEPDFTEYVKALRYSDTYNALNQSTTGVSFTAFAPTNEAMQEFYGRRNVSSLEELPQSYVRSFVLYHTLPDSITSDKFVTKKSVTNLVGDVLSVEIDSVNAGQATINGEGHVVEMGISAYNGKVYVMSKAMTPLVETVLDRIVDAGQSSIMVGAIKETGWDKSLSVIQDTTLIEGVQTITKHYFTVFNVTDATFAKAGINSLADLKSKLKARDERGLAEDSLLREYVSYHIIGNMLKRADLAGAEGQLRIWSASAKNQVFTIQEDTLATDDNLRYTINGAGESAQFVAANSDVLSRNGYVHELNAWLPVWEPEQATVVWDFADYADIKSIVPVEEYQPVEPVTTETRFRVSNAPCFTFEMGESGSKNSSYSDIDYVTTKAYKVSGETLTANNNDRIVFNLGYMGSVEMTTPTIVRGKYRLELSIIYTSTQSFMRQQTDGNGGLVKITFDEDKETGEVPTPDHKVYTTPYTKVPSALPGIYKSTIIDEIEFTETSAHNFKMVILDPAASSNSKFSLQFDCITFIPVQ
ncbi:MAG: DUF5108 domain-containing protein [Prevotella sp.]|nr:DUF5108 domain-containing protein [Prevotella sp.]